MQLTTSLNTKSNLANHFETSDLIEMAVASNDIERFRAVTELAKRKSPELDIEILLALKKATCFKQTELWAALSSLVSDPDAFLSAIFAGPHLLGRHWLSSPVPQASEASRIFAERCSIVPKLFSGLLAQEDPKEWGRAYDLMPTFAAQLQDLLPLVLEDLNNPERRNSALESLRYFTEVPKDLKSKIHDFLRSEDSCLAKSACLALYAFDCYDETDVAAVLPLFRLKWTDQVACHFLTHVLSVNPALDADVALGFDSTSALIRKGTANVFVSLKAPFSVAQVLFDKIVNQVRTELNSKAREAAVAALARFEDFDSFLEELLPDVQVNFEQDYIHPQYIRRMQFAQRAKHSQEVCLKIADLIAESFHDPEKICRLAQILRSDRESSYREEPMALLKFQILLPLLEHESEKVRGIVIQAISSISDIQLITTYASMSEKEALANAWDKLPNDVARKFYLLVCCDLEINTDPIKTLTISMLKHNRQDIRLEAAHLIRVNHWNDEKFLPGLAAMISSEDEEEISAGANALVCFSEETVVPMVNNALKAGSRRQSTLKSHVTPLRALLALYDPTVARAILGNKEYGIYTMLLNLGVVLEKDKSRFRQVLVSSYSPSEETPIPYKDAFLAFVSDLEQFHAGMACYPQIRLINYLGPEGAPLIDFVVRQIVAESSEFQLSLYVPNALLALGNVGALAYPQLGFVQQYLEHEKPQFSAAAHYAHQKIVGLGKAVTGAELSALRSKLSDLDPAVRYNAMRRSSRLPANQLKLLTPEISQLLCDPVINIAVDAASPIGSIISDNEDLQKAIYKICFDEEKDLATFPENVLIRLVETVSNNFSSFVPPPAAIMRGLRDSRAAVRIQFCLLVAKNTPHRAYEDLLLQSAMSEGSEVIGCYALSKLSLISKSASREILKHKETAVGDLRCYALQALARSEVSAISDEAKEALGQYIRERDDGSSYASTASLALSKLDKFSGKVIEDLIAGLEHANVDVRYSCSIALENVVAELKPYKLFITRRSQLEDNSYVQDQLVYLVNAVD